MDNFTILIITTYLYALFLLMLRIKVSFKAIQFFKSLLIILAITSLVFLINYTGDIQIFVRVMVFIPVPYVCVMTYISELGGLFKKAGMRRRVISPRKTDNELAEELLTSVEFLSKRKIGALITIERYVNLTPFINKALLINADFSKELLTSIFIPSTPLHDGAVIIRGNKILCAKTYYPSTERTDLPMNYGTRHRAAIGISEQSDALTIVVSEETGFVSVTINRQMEYNVSKETLNLYFEKFIQKD
ncbi:MAG: DNA integrity scanning protein DisA nucleotide-binding domain protein [Tenericutes bacterium]|nr:DNA integrity scanning protein DisA nucleotide-binding domain protein [Mycoplasmatota bacterium]